MPRDGGAGGAVRDHDDDGHGPQQGGAAPLHSALAALLQVGDGILPPTVSLRLTRSRCCRFAGLVRYLHPSDDELRVHAPAPKLEKKDKKKQRHQEKNGAATSSSAATFNIPRNTDIQLETAPVDLADVVQLRYYTEYQWLLDFSLYSMLTYILSEVYIFLMPERSSTEANLSLVWVILVILFTYKLLLSLNGLYFEGIDL